MPLHSYFVLVAFTLLVVVFITRIAALRSKNSAFLGVPTIDKYYFFSGKITLFTTWILFVLKAVIPKLGYIQVPVYLCWTATGLLWVGVIIVSIGMVGLGKSMKMGLPGEETQLQTRGIFRLSRNPLYTGTFIIGIASCLYFPDLINASFTIFGIYMHHRIILGEEQFLHDRFGKAWEAYCMRVKRYI
ncbi:MAG: isoprenylcysteine carboxylmethyltransferase family protein [Bacteroidota bacterium]